MAMGRHPPLWNRRHGGVAATVQCLIVMTMTWKYCRYDLGEVDTLRGVRWAS